MQVGRECPAKACIRGLVSRVISKVSIVIPLLAPLGYLEPYLLFPFILQVKLALFPTYDKPQPVGNNDNFT